MIPVRGLASINGFTTRNRTPYDKPFLPTPFAIASAGPGSGAETYYGQRSLKRLDSIIAVYDSSRTSLSPPSADQWDRFLVPESATGDWSGQDNMIAEWQDGEWHFIAPQSGWTAFVADESRLVIFDDETWVTPSVPPAIDITAIGINAQADLQNRLTVKSDAALFSHDDVTPGSGSMRLTMNKAAATQTTSLIFQSDYSGRAEIGLAGEDALSVKVSADGSDFEQALRVDPATARVELPRTPPVASPFNLLPDAGRFAGVPEPNSTSAASFDVPDYMSVFNGGAFAAGPKFIHDNGTYGGTKASLDPIIDELITKIKTSSGARRYGPEFFNLAVTAGAGTGGLRDVDGVSHYLAITNPAVPLPAVFSWNFHLCVTSGSVTISTLSTAQTLRDGVEEAGDFRIVSAEGCAQITHLHDVPTGSDLGYSTDFLSVYAAPGSEFLIATPTFSPGHLPSKPGRYYLVTPGFKAWR